MGREGKYIIRGKPGSGKSTAIMIVKERLENLGVRVGGIRTPEVRSGGRRIGFEVENLLTGERSLFASVSYRDGPKISKYGVRIDLFEKVAIPALENSMRECDLVLVDEIGKMELFSDRFVEVVRKLWGSDRAALGTAPISKIKFVEEMCSLSEVLWIERGMAERVAEKLVERILRYLGRL
ncbi:MAG: nucleoside-triphosphatase [Candidatus Korarchaeota archaeon]|nr:nucleoside-triphosphatase [Candidatus Korarchaeota archaeon]